jgi:hypothetical protein
VREIGVDCTVEWEYDWGGIEGGVGLGVVLDWLSG